VKTVIGFGLASCSSGTAKTNENERVPPMQSRPETEAAKKIKTLEHRVESSQIAIERIEILGQIAKIYEEELSDEESAFLVIQTAFREDFSHEETSRELERLATTLGRWDELMQVYTKLVRVLQTENETTKACNLWVMLGHWYGDILEIREYAIYSVQQCLLLDADHRGATSALSRLRGAHRIER